MITSKKRGLFGPVNWGLFHPQKGGLFTPVKWGLFRRNFQLPNYSSIIKYSTKLPHAQNFTQWKTNQMKQPLNDLKVTAC